MNIDKHKVLAVQLLFWFAGIIGVLFLFLLSFTYINGYIQPMHITMFATFVIMVLVIVLTFLQYYNLAKYLVIIVPPYAILLISIIEKHFGIYSSTYSYLIPRIFEIIYLMASVIFFGLRQYKKMLITFIILIPPVFLFGFTHQLFGIDIEKLIIDSKFYHLFVGMLSFFFGMALLSILFSQRTNILFKIKIITQSRQIIEEKEKIEMAHKDIISNIEYAKSIQAALLTSDKLIDTYFKDYFLLFKPKEQVSGDFYYINKINNHLIFAVADCTGHGVTGGFLTMLGITYLHEIVRQKEIVNADVVLNMLRQRIKSTFKTFGSENRNGLDIAFCVIDTDTNILQYAGAFNPLWIIRNNNLIEYKATRNPVGFYLRESEFENNIIQLQNEDKIYLFSDGYNDQVSEKTEKKYSKKQFKNLLFKNHKKDSASQKNELEKQLKTWQGNYEQIDDITILGVNWKM